MRRIIKALVRGSVKRSKENLYMTKFKGFETKKEAQKYAKKNGGVVYSKTKAQFTPYWESVHLGGLNAEKFPFVVIIRNV